MKPPSGDAGEVDAARRDATSMRPASDSFVHTTSAPRSAAMRSASLGDVDTGSAMRAPRVRLGHERRRARAAPGRSSSDVARRRRRSWPCSPSGSMTKPRSLPDARTSSATRATCAVAVVDGDVADAVLANGLTASTSAPSLASTFGITIDAAPNE